MDKKTVHRRLCDGMSPEERLETLRRAGVKGDLLDVMRRNTRMTPEQAIFASKKEKK
jgi:hypothetical protein